jgi:hypothetical protein
MRCTVPSACPSCSQRWSPPPEPQPPITLLPLLALPVGASLWAPENGLGGCGNQSGPIESRDDHDDSPARIGGRDGPA